MPVAIKPFSGSIPSGVDRSPTIPPYEDACVKYQGYYKQKVSNGEYILKKQYANFREVFFFSDEGIQSSSSVFVNKGFRFCITQIIATPSADLSGTVLANVHIFPKQTSPDVSHVYSVNFPLDGANDGIFISDINPPLCLEQDYRVQFLVTGTVTSGSLTVQIFGYVEEI